MADAAPSSFLWDCIYERCERNLKTKGDVIIAVTHWFLIERAHFKCLGIGDEKILRENEKRTSLLPEQWHATSPLYSIRYIHGDTVYILLGKTEDNQLTITLNLAASETKPTKVVLHLNELVNATEGDLITMIPRQDYVLERLRFELLPPNVLVFSGPRQDVCNVPLSSSDGSMSWPF